MISLLAGFASAVMASATAQEAAVVHHSTNVELVAGIMMFVIAGFLLAFGGLTAGRFLRPHLPGQVKGETYECGEPAIGDAWVQFDLRFYTVALIFIVFDVEVALLWPWAVAFKELGTPGLWAFVVFLLLIAIPFAYEWKSGFLDWVRASSGQERSSELESRAGM